MRPLCHREVRLVRGALPSLVLLLLAGCVLPPTIEEEPVVEQPHWVDEEQVDPPPWRVFRVDLDDKDQEFYVGGAIENPSDDELYYYWYLLEENDEGGVAPIHTDEELFVFEPCATDSVLQALSANAGDYVEMYLELDITNARRLQGDDGSELSEPRSYPDDTRVVTVSWFLLFNGDCE